MFMLIMSDLSEQVQKFILVTPSLLRKSCPALKFARENVYIENPFKVWDGSVPLSCFYPDRRLTPMIYLLTLSTVGWGEKDKGKTEKTHVLK